MDTLKEFDVHFVVGEKSEACHVSQNHSLWTLTAHGRPAPGWWVNPNTVDSIVGNMPTCHVKSQPQRQFGEDLLTAFS